LLGIDETSSEDTALFACAVKDDSAALPDKGLQFVEMRKAIMNLSTKEASLVSRVMTLH